MSDNIIDRIFLPFLTNDGTRFTKDITYERIKKLIINGTFPMGKKISERKLEQSLKANKAPIRDALKRLQAEGMVVRKAKSGTYVFSLTKKELLDLLKFRFVIESQSVLLSFEENADKLISETEKILLKMRLALTLNQGKSTLFKMLFFMKPWLTCVTTVIS